MTIRALIGVVLTASAIAASPVLPSDRGKNLLTNPGFEAGISGWQSIGDSQAITIDDKVWHRGGHSLRLLGKDAQCSQGVEQTITFDKPLQHPLRVSGWSKALGAAVEQNYDVYLDVHYDDGTPLWGQIAEFAPGTHDWQYSETIFDVAKPVKSIEVFVLFRRAKGTVWFDDIEVTPVPLALRSVEVRPNLFGGSSVSVVADTTLPAHWTAELLGPGGTVARRSGSRGPIRLDWMGRTGLRAAQQDYTVRITATDDLLGEKLVDERKVRLDRRAPQRGFALWTDSSMARVLPPALPPVGSAAPRADIALAGHEYASFQVLLRSAPGQRVGTVTVQPGDLVCPASGKRIAAANVEWQQVGFVKLEKLRKYSISLGASPGWWPDPLLPVSSFELLPDFTQPIWVTVYAPAGTPAGEYTGTVKVLAGATTVPVEVRAKVYGFSLPVEGHMKTAFALMDGYLEKLYRRPLNPALRVRYGDFVLKHRINPDDISRTAPPAIEDLLHYRDRGLNAFNVLNMVKERGDATWVCWSPLEVYTPAFKQHLLDRLDPYVKRLRETGLISKAYIYTFDERGEEFYPVMREFFGMVKERYPQIHTLTTAQVPLDPAKMRSINVDWNCPLTPRYDYAQAEKCRKAGLQVWTYTCCGPREPYANILGDDPLIEARVLWWQMYQQQVDGFLFWGLNIWDGPHNDKPIDLSKGPLLDWGITTGGPRDEQWLQELHGDGRLIYAGPNGPIGSIRLANIRDGLQDYEYLWLLAKGLGSVEEGRKACLPVTDSLTHFTFDPKVVERQRDAVARRVEGK